MSEAGPYAKVLVGEIAKPGIEAVRMVGNERWRVRAATMQEPYLRFNALGEVFLGASRTRWSNAQAHRCARTTGALPNLR